MDDNQNLPPWVREELARLRARATELEELEDHYLTMSGTGSDRTIRELASSNERLAVLFEHAPDGYYINDMSGNFLDGNRKAEELAGYTKEEMIGKNFFTLGLLAPEELPRAADILKRNFKGRSSGPDEFVLVRKDGSRVQVEITTHPVRLGDQDVVLGIARDITERRLAETEREKLKAQLYQADKMTTVGQLAAGIAHEINNPIGFILPNLKTLQRSFERVADLTRMCLRGGGDSAINTYQEEHGIGGLLDDIPELIAECIEGAERVRNTTSELRQFSRRDQEETEQVQLIDLLESSLTIAANEIRYRAQVRKHYTDLPKVRANRGKLSQVFLNLLVNAAQAIEAGYADENWIRVATGRQAEKIYVEIANSGEPIPPEHLPRIFDPFFTTKPHGQGTGLGLAISYTTVQQHGGYIEVESSPETGTRFRVWLPAEPGLAKRPVPSSLEPDFGRSRGRVLVIDDEPGILRAMERILSQVHEVETAGSGEEALGRIDASVGFDVVFCDLMMPGLSGMELYERVVGKYPEFSTRFVFMTGGAFTDQAQSFARQVTNTKLEKPIESRDMLSVVGEMLRKRS